MGDPGHHPMKSVTKDEKVESPSAEQIWLTPKEFMARYGIGRTLMYESLRQGRLRHVRIGSKILVRGDALELLEAKQL